jgi:hypothetical protein
MYIILPCRLSKLAGNQFVQNNGSRRLEILMRTISTPSGYAMPIHFALFCAASFLPFNKQILFISAKKYKFSIT